MSRTFRYLSHPQVVINPDQPVQDWSLNAEGKRRVATLAGRNALHGTNVIISSAETKATETAGPLAKALDCALEVRPLMHENDRSSTGFLNPDEFETVADQFFATPDQSVRDWETARAAQTRIVGEVMACLQVHNDGDVLFVGHGGVGTLLFCHLSDLSISRAYDQGPGGGGCYFEFGWPDLKPRHGWRPMEHLGANASSVRRTP